MALFLWFALRGDLNPGERGSTTSERRAIERRSAEPMSARAAERSEGQSLRLRQL